jgi:hypothetical protein
MLQVHQLAHPHLDVDVMTSTSSRFGETKVDQKLHEVAERNIRYFPSQNSS